MTEVDVNNYRFLEINYLNFNLLLFVQMDPDNKNINKRATRLSGIYKIYGSCILVCKTAENDFINITEEMYNKLDKTSWGDMKDRELTEHEKDTETKINNLDVIINNFNILENRYRKLNDTTINNNYRYVCTGCYRKNIYL